MSALTREVQIWEARGFSKVLANGRNKPLVLNCIQQNVGVFSREFVVKAIGSPGVLPDTLFRELFGNLLARACGITTAEPAIIALTPAVVDSIQPRLPPEIQLRSGWAVGCQYLPAIIPLVPDFGLTTALSVQAAQIYAFDLWVRNPDRHTGNPNCGLHRGDLIAYDFDCAFTRYGSQPWELTAFGIAEDHVFHNRLRDAAVNWEPFAAKLKSLDESRLRGLIKDWPPGWLVDSERIFGELLDARDRLPLVLVELERSLRMIT